MTNLLFFSRIAFLCNICFVLAFVLQYSPWLPHDQITSTIVIMGYLMVALNFVVNICMIALLINKKRIDKAFPRWLIIANFLFLIPELIVFFA